MKTAEKTAIKSNTKSKKPAPVKPKKLSKAGLAMKKGIGRGTIIELTPDPWNLNK